MALVEGILAFLPLQRLIEAYWPQPLFERISRQRTGLVNGLTEAQYQKLLTLDRLQEWRPVERYIAICTYQGELSDMAWFFLPIAFLRQRAVFLRDVPSLYYFMSLSEPDETPRGREVQAIFASQDPAIWATALAHFPCLKPDPYQFRWTEGLKKHFLRFLLEETSQYDTLAESLVEKLLAFLRPRLPEPEDSEAQKFWYMNVLTRETTDGYLPGLQLSLLDAQTATDADCINFLLGGYMARDLESVMLKALLLVNPNVCLYCLRQKLSSPGVAIAPIFQGILGREEVLRSQSVLRLLPPGWDHYRDSLRIVTGQRAEHPEEHLLELLAVAHPQLAELSDLAAEVEDAEPGTTLYQPTVWLTLPNELLKNETLLETMYEQGLLLSVLGRSPSLPTNVIRPRRWVGPAQGDESYCFTVRRQQLLELYGAPLPPQINVFAPTIDDLRAVEKIPGWTPLRGQEGFLRKKAETWQQIFQEISQ